MRKVRACWATNFILNGVVSRVVVVGRALLTLLNLLCWLIANFRATLAVLRSFDVLLLGLESLRVNNWGFKGRLHALLLLLIPEPNQAQVLSLDKTLQVRVRLLELLEDVRRAVAVTSRVVRRVDRVYDYKHRLVLLR